MTYFPTGASEATGIVATALTTTAFKTAVRQHLTRVGNGARDNGMVVVATMNSARSIWIDGIFVGDMETGRKMFDRIVAAPNGSVFVGLFENQNGTWAAVKTEKINEPGMPSWGLPVVAAVGGVALLWHLTKGKKR